MPCIFDIKPEERHCRYCSADAVLDSNKDGIIADTILLKKIKE